MSDKKFIILGKEIKRGQSALLEIEVAKLHTRNSLRIPIIVERAKEDGPVLLLMGGVHGDELNGVAIVRDINALFTFSGCFTDGTVDINDGFFLKIYHPSC